MLALLKTVQLPWEKARGFLRLDLQTIESTINQRWADTFGSNNILNVTTIASGSIDLTSKVTGILPVTNGGTGTGTPFTLGSVVFAGAGGIYAQDNANLFWDETNKRLGVGVTPPLAAYTVSIGSGFNPSIHIQDTGVGTSAAFVIFLNNGSNFFIGKENSAGGALAIGDIAYAAVLNSASTYPMQFAVNNAVAMTILNGGNVGIGTQAPGVALDIVGTARISTNIISPRLIGGSAVGQQLILQSTTGIGTTDNIAFVTGNNGATTVATFNHDGSATFGSLLTAFNLMLATSGRTTYGIHGAIANAADGVFDFQNGANTSSTEIGPGHLYIAHDSGGNAIVANGAGIFLLSNEAQSIGFTLNGSTADILALKNRANSGDATLTDLNTISSGYIQIGPALTFPGIAGDLLVNRGGASPGTGAIFFGSSNPGTKYIYYDGTYFNINNSVVINGNFQAGNGQYTGKISTYGNITTTGWGVPAIYGTGRSPAQTGAVASVATYTLPAVDGSFYVSVNINVTAYVAGTLTATCAYTDETNTPRVLTFNFSNLTGTLANTIGATGPFEGLVMHIRCKASTSITIATTVALANFTYNVEGSITQIA